MTRGAIVHLVTKLYAAAGARDATEVDFEVYAEALENLTDERGAQACRRLIQTVDLARYRPSPAVVLEAAREIADEEYRMPKRGPKALTEGEPTPSAVARVRLAQIRAQYDRRHISEPRHIGESL